MSQVQNHVDGRCNDDDEKDSATIAQIDLFIRSTELRDTLQ